MSRAPWSAIALAILEGLEGLGGRMARAVAMRAIAIAASGTP